ERSASEPDNTSLGHAKPWHKRCPPSSHSRPGCGRVRASGPQRGPPRHGRLAGSCWAYGDLAVSGVHGEQRGAKERHGASAGHAHVRPAHGRFARGDAELPVKGSDDKKSGKGGKRVQGNVEDSWLAANRACRRIPIAGDEFTATYQGSEGG